MRLKMLFPNNMELQYRFWSFLMREMTFMLKITLFLVNQISLFKKKIIILMS